MPIDYKDYPRNWKTIIRPAILRRAKNCCEGSPKFPDCRAKNHMPHPITGSNVVLTVAHMDHNIRNNDYSNLRALCQLCHINHDKAQQVASRKYGKKHTGDHQMKLFDQ